MAMQQLQLGYGKFRAYNGSFGEFHYPFTFSNMSKKKHVKRKKYVCLLILYCHDLTSFLIVSEFQTIAKFTKTTTMERERKKRRRLVSFSANKRHRKFSIQQDERKEEMKSKVKQHKKSIIQVGRQSTIQNSIVQSTRMSRGVFYLSRQLPRH